MTRTPSLRMRLTAIILLPVLAVAAAAGLWQLDNARQTAADVFNRSLLSAALAVANDVAISGGDALSPRTRDILSDTSGGEVFYHVYAPDGVIVAGYATPPVGIPASATEIASPTYFYATYLGRQVSGVRLQTSTQVDGFAGIFTTTVWQDTSVRTAFVRQLVMRSVITISVLMASLALIVWFGVRLGLRPLLSLEDAIEKRSSDELSPIRRAVPSEVKGIVQTLNGLFAQVSRSMTAQADFISNAAHQLRNPIAGVLSLAEAVHKAPSAAEAKRRSTDLLAAARETAELSNKLLLLERAKSISPASSRQDVRLGECLAAWVGEFRSDRRGDVDVRLNVDAELGEVECDPVMLREAVRNLVDNAIRHGGPALTTVEVSATRVSGTVRLCVADDGTGIPETDLPSATERFRQVSSGSGSGLGLSIARAVAIGHNGAFHVANRKPGLEVVLQLPVL